MTTTAIFMMVLFMATVWGGLLIAVANLNRNPDYKSGVLGTSPGTTDAELSAMEVQ